MKIKSLKIQNFKRIESQEFVFDNRINVIAGGNGSGKSSLVDAITYLLTDELPENISEYVNWKNGKDAKIDAAIEFDGKQLQYTITLKIKGSTERVLKIEGDDTVYRNSDCVKKLKELYNPKLLFYSGIATQHEATSLLFESPAERLKKLKEILSVERVNDVVARIKEDLDVARAMEKHLTTEIDSIFSRKYDYVKVEALPDISDLQNRIDALKILKAEFDEAYADYKKDLTAYNVYVSESAANETNKAKIPLIEDKFVFINLIQVLDADLDELERTKKLVTDCEKQLLLYTSYLKELQSYEKSKVDYEKKIISLEKDFNAIGLKRLAKPEVDKTQIETLTKEIADLTLALRVEKSHLALAKEGKCGTCGQDYPEDPAKCEVEVARLNAEIKTKTDYKNECQAILDQYDEAKRNNDLLVVKKQGIENSLNEYKELLAGLVAPGKVTYDAATYEEAKKSLIALNKQHDEFLASEKQAKEAKEKNLKLQADIDSLTASIARFEEKYPNPVEEPEEPVFKYQAELNQAVRELAVYEEKVAQFEKLTKFNEDVKQREDADKTQLQVLAHELDEKSVEVRNLEAGRKLLEKDFSAYLIDTGSSYIKNNMNLFFNKVYGRYDIDFRRDSKSVQFFYSPDKIIYKPVGVAAGFEKQLISMGFRIATSNMQNTRFYLLDEADSSAEDENSLLMYETLLAEDIEQLICVTHKEVTKEYLVNEKNGKLFQMVA